MADRSKAEYKSLDPIQDAMGGLGRWQIIIAVALSLINFPAGWRQFANEFVAPNILFTCLEPNTTSEDACKVGCTKFDYNRTIFSTTIVSEWDLVCQHEYLQALVQTMTMLGLLVGNMVFSMIADKAGRKGPLMVAIIAQPVLSIVATFMPTYGWYLAITTLSSIATGGTMLISFVIIMEIVGVEWREKVAVLFHIPYIMSIFSVPLLSFATKAWKPFLYSISIPSFLLLSFYWIVPESPRWLLALGRIEEARKILEYAAKKNRVPQEKVTLAIQSHEREQTKSEIPVTTKKYTTLDLFKTPNMRINTCCLIVNWLSCGVYFYGVMGYISNLSNNIFMNIAIAASFQFPGILIVYVLLTRVSRLRLLISGNILAGLSMLLITFVQEYEYEVLNVFLASAGLCGMTICFTTIYLYTGEVFPTVVRNAGFGVCSVCSRVGSMIAPFIVKLKIHQLWLPSTIFSIGPILGALLCLMLPETMGCTLPETIEDAENFRSEKKKSDMPLESVRL